MQPKKKIEEKASPFCHKPIDINLTSYKNKGAFGKIFIKGDKKIRKSKCYRNFLTLKFSYYARLNFYHAENLLFLVDPFK